MSQQIVITSEEIAMVLRNRENEARIAQEVITRNKAIAQRKELVDKLTVLLDGVDPGDIDQLILDAAGPAYKGFRHQKYQEREREIQQIHDDYALKADPDAFNPAR